MQYTLAIWNRTSLQLGCDNPPCCNPAHLFAGTQADNLADARRKGRAHRLPPLVGRHQAGESARALARAYGVARNAIGLILAGRTWRER